jgi:hypothetical protein
VVSEANRIKRDAPKRCGSCLTASYADAALPMAGVMTKAPLVCRWNPIGSNATRHPKPAPCVALNPLSESSSHTYS